MDKHLNIAFFSILFLLSACGKNNSKPQAQVDLKTTSEFAQNFNYEYTGKNNCSTKKQNFTSLEDLCSGLQNNNLNNNCAIDSRRSYFKEMCPGLVFTPFTIKNKKDKLPLVGFQERYLKKNAAFLDIFKALPEWSGSNSSVLTTFSCIDDMSIRDLFHNGFMLLNNSRIVINRDLDYLFADGSKPSKQTLPHVIYNCEDEMTQLDRDYMNDQEIELKRIQFGESLYIPVIISQMGVTKQVKLTMIKCTDNGLIAHDGSNGVLMFQGSRLAIKRDIEYFRKKIDTRESVVISCE